MEFIDLKKQYKLYSADINKKIQEVLKHGKYIMGPEVTELENKLSKFLDIKNCITVSNGTHSLEISLRALGITYGDEVITVPHTWISSAEVIRLVGAKPIFVDINPLTFNIDEDKIENAITSKTKAIIPVSLYGQMSNMEKINSIANKYNIPVIEDAAQSFGAERNKIKSCSASLIGSTSFFPAKPFGCYGDGGAIFTNDDKLSDIIKSIRTHGALVRHNHNYIGTNGRFDTIQAAVLLAKFPHFKNEIKKRSEIGLRYSRNLKDYVKVPYVLNGNTHVYAQYTIRVNNKIRNHIIQSLKDKGIPSGIYYPKPIHLQKAFSDLNYKLGDFPESEKAASEVISLPMHPFLEKKDQDYIINTLIKIIKTYE